MKKNILSSEEKMSLELPMEVLRAWKDQQTIYSYIRKKQLETTCCGMPSTDRKILTEKGIRSHTAGDAIFEIVRRYYEDPPNVELESIEVLIDEATIKVIREMEKE